DRRRVVEGDVLQEWAEADPGGGAGGEGEQHVGIPLAQRVDGCERPVPAGLLRAPDVRREGQRRAPVVTVEAERGTSHGAESLAAEFTATHVVPSSTGRFNTVTAGCG